MSVFDRPPDELDREALVSRGQHAARLLADEVLQAAHEDAERRILDTWRLAEGLEVREMAWGAVQAMDRIREALQRYVAEGEYAAAALEKGARKP